MIKCLINIALRGRGREWTCTVCKLCECFDGHLIRTQVLTCVELFLIIVLNAGAIEGLGAIVRVQGLYKCWAGASDVRLPGLRRCSKQDVCVCKKMNEHRYFEVIKTWDVRVQGLQRCSEQEMRGYRLV